MRASLRMNFATEGPAGGRRGLIVLSLGIALALGCGLTHVHLQREIQIAEARADVLARRAAPRMDSGALDEGRLRALRQRIEASNRVIAALDHPWIRFFDEIESAHVRGIVLTALDPDAEKLGVHLAGEAADREALARYLERLGALASLSDVRLSQHEWREHQGKTALRFVVSARWVPST